MNKPLPLLFTLLGVWILGTSMWRYTSGCCNAVAPISNVAPTETIIPPLVPPVAAPTKNILVEDNANLFSLGVKDNLSFELSSHAYIMPLSDSLSAVFDGVANYLKLNPNRSIRLTGQYQSNEENGSILSTLGLGRANQVKKILVDLGAPDNQIELADNLINAVDTFEDDLTNAVTYGFFATPAIDENQLKAIEKRLRANPLVLYFNTDAKKLELTAEQRQFFTDLMLYLSKKPKAILKSTGHTDDRGEYVRNKYLSRKRAEFTRDYLVKNGIQEKQIWVFYEGPDQPIDTNESPEGRAKNRRVEITLR